MSKSTPILFNSEMVRAILDGRKTQTRRVISNQILNRFEDLNPNTYGNGIPSYETEMGCEVLITDLCPFGQIGDRLWVRETWAMAPRLVYRADYQPLSDVLIKWKPSIHMIKSFSRITLEITGVRVERLQDISVDDAVAEGIHPDTSKYQVDLSDWSFNPIEEFAGLWDSINSKKHPWQSNPWVWAVTFQLIR